MPMNFAVVEVSIASNLCKKTESNKMCMCHNNAGGFNLTRVAKVE